MSDEAAVAVALRTGRRVVVPHLDDARLAAFLPDPEVAELTRRLDPWGVAVLPLNARNRTYGVLVSATTSERGSHTPDEIELLHEIARRAGPVLDAARAARRARTFTETMQRSLLVTSPAGARACTSPPATARPISTARSAATGTTSTRCPTARPRSPSATSWATISPRSRPWRSCGR